MAPPTIRGCVNRADSSLPRTPQVAAQGSISQVMADGPGSQQTSSATRPDSAPPGVSIDRDNCMAGDFVPAPEPALVPPRLMSG